MDIKNSNSKVFSSAGALYDFLARRAWSVLILCALFCNLAVKFYFSYRTGRFAEYAAWILTDVAVLLVIEVICSSICFRWRRRWVIRLVTVFAAVVCTWSIVNAAWLIRTGVQALPQILLPLVRDPLNSLAIVGVSLAKMPVAAVALLGPSAIALVFLFSVLARPKLPKVSSDYFSKRVIISVLIALMAVLVWATMIPGPIDQVSVGLSFNCQLRAVVNFFLPGPGKVQRADIAEAKRQVAVFDQINLPQPNSPAVNYNVVIVVLEGIQYRQTSLANKYSNLTPYLRKLAEEGVSFTNFRCSITHTTKALFSLCTGRFASPSQDIAEAVPTEKPYASIATILKENSNYRTAFFQSAKGDFECRPGLVHNLGFDKFWAREDHDDPNAYLGYLACDEFSMIKPIAKWIRSDDSPFFLTIMCSVSHDPYVVPQWFAEPAKDSLERYRQTIDYTDKFIEQLDKELGKLDLTDNTIFCVVGDHGEGFGEHGLSGHERIAFEEALNVPCVVRGPSLIEPRTVIKEPVSSIDLTPTLLGILGFDIEAGQFDGVDGLAALSPQRNVYFAGWMQESPAGFVKEKYKYIYYPNGKTLAVYDLDADRFESTKIEMEESASHVAIEQINNWRRNNIFHIDQEKSGQKRLFNSWDCRWNNRISSAKYQPDEDLHFLTADE